MSSIARSVVLCLAVVLGAPQARAQLPPAQPAPADDPRRGPRLSYRQGPRQCLPEAEFRGEVAIAARDGVDHLHDDSPDVVRVWFEKIPGGFRGTVVYTDAKGVEDAPQVHTSDHCHVLARWVAGTVSDTLPLPPAPTCPPTPAPPPCPACPVCGTCRPPAPCPVPPKPPAWRMDFAVAASAYVLMSAGLTANVAPGIGIAGDIRGDIFGLGLELRVVVPSVVYARDPVPGTTPPFRQVDFDVSQVSALLVPCARYSYFVGCGVAQIGGLFTQTTEEFQGYFSYAFGPRIGFEIPFAERFAVFGFGEALFYPFQRGVDFVYPNPQQPDVPPANTRWAQSVVSGYFGAGLSVRFR